MSTLSLEDRNHDAGYVFIDEDVETYWMWIFGESDPGETIELIRLVEDAGFELLSEDEYPSQRMYDGGVRIWLAKVDGGANGAG